MFKYLGNEAIAKQNRFQLIQKVSHGTNKFLHGGHDQN